MSITPRFDTLKSAMETIQDQINQQRVEMAKILLSHLQDSYQRLQGAIGEGESLRRERERVVDVQVSIPPELMQIEQKISSISSRIVNAEQEIVRLQGELKKSVIKQDLQKLRVMQEQFNRHAHEVRYTPSHFVSSAPAHEEIVKSSPFILRYLGTSEQKPGQPAVFKSFWPEYNPAEYEV